MLLSQPTTFLPAASLRNVIDHYWLSSNDGATTFVALPDGAVDLVIESGGQGWVYGTPTRRMDITLVPGRQYLGIRFRPGQSRHVMRGSSTSSTLAFRQCLPQIGMCNCTRPEPAVLHRSSWR